MNHAKDEQNGTHNHLLRDLKGAPLSVLLALALYGEQGRPDLVKRSGWSRFAVSGALTDLVQMGLVRRVHFRGWAVRQGLDLAHLLGPDGLRQTPEGPPHSLSESESEEPSSGCAEERAPQSLWDAQRSSDGLWARQLTANVAAAERTAHSPSTSERTAHNPSAPEQHPHDPSPPERTAHSPSPHYDHDLMGQTDEPDLEHPSSKQTSDTTDTQELLQDLELLDPPFDHAQAWLQQTSPALVRAWLDHLLDMDPQRRQRIRNEAAFLRAKVGSGHFPPPPTERAARRARRRLPCPTCGKALRDAYGRCLICAGVVQV